MLFSSECGLQCLPEIQVNGKSCNWHAMCIIQNMYNTYDVINLFQASAVKRPDIHPYSIKLMDMIKYHRIFQ